MKGCPQPEQPIVAVVVKFFQSTECKHWLPYTEMHLPCDA